MQIKKNNLQLLNTYFCLCYKPKLKISNMKRRLWQITAFIITFFVIIYTFFCHEINLTQANSNIQKLEDCFIRDLSDNELPENSLCRNAPQQRLKTISTTHNFLSTPNSLSDFIAQKRFLKAISANLPIVPEPNSFEHILLRSYGAAYVNNQPGIKLPQKLVFANEKETKEFQATLIMGKVNGTRNCYLQKPAADALNKARARIRIPLMSRNGHINCTRSFATTVRLWRKYTNDRTLEQVRQGKETRILGVVAPPGTSQHLWGLAVDLRVTNKAQKKILNQNGWYRTVKNDTPHWTYVGYSPEELAVLGFKNKIIRGTKYWLTPL